MLIALAIVTASCSSSSVTPAPISEPAADAGGDGAAPSSTAWPLGACGTCVTAGCAGPRQVCDAEPSCAAHSACAEKCPADAGGAIDAACLAACPRGDNTVASRSRAAYDACLTGSGQKGCDACPKPAAQPPPFNEVLDQKCGGSTETNACFKCQDLSCCNTDAACNAEPECTQGVVPCAKACKDATCRAKCYDDHPKGVAAYARKLACISVRCVGECSGAPVDPCYECGVVKACRETNARCAADPGCFVLRACLEATCPDVTDACIDSCKAKAPASAGVLLENWFACTGISCTGVCS